MKVGPLLGGVLLILSVCVNADEVTLKSGDLLSGNIIEHNFDQKLIRIQLIDRQQLIPLDDIADIQYAEEFVSASRSDGYPIQEQSYQSVSNPVSLTRRYGAIYTFANVGYYLDDIHGKKATYQVKTIDLAFQMYFKKYYGLEAATYFGDGSEIVIEDRDDDPDTKPFSVSSGSLTPYSNASVKGGRVAGLVGWGLSQPGILAYLAPGGYIEQVRFKKKLGGTKTETVAGLFAKFALGYSWSGFSTGFWGNFRMGSPSGFKPNRSTQGGWMFCYQF